MKELSLLKVTELEGKRKKKNQEKAGVVFKDSKVGPVGTGAKSFSSLSRSKSHHFMRP